MKYLALCIAILTIQDLGGAGAAVAGVRPATCLQATSDLGLNAPTPRDLAFPNFCDIPPAPKSVPTASAFKADVVGVRLAGARLDATTGPDTWSLSGTDAFAETARREVEPPPPMTTPSHGSTEAFAAESQTLATPPPRHHRKPH